MIRVQHMMSACASLPSKHLLPHPYYTVGQTCSLIPNATYVDATPYASIPYLDIPMCCRACYIDNPRCVAYTYEGTFQPLEGPHVCYLFDDIASSELEPAFDFNSGETSELPSGTRTPSFGLATKCAFVNNIGL